MKALIAEHFPSQLTPRPQVVNSMLLFVWQQVTSIDWLAFVSVFSKKALVFSEEIVGGLVVDPGMFPVVDPGMVPVVNSVGVLAFSVLIILHSFNNIVVFTCGNIVNNSDMSSLRDDDIRSSSSSHLFKF